MNQRERILALGVGGLLLAILVQWGVGSYRTGIKKLKNQLANLQNEQDLLDERITQGFLAERQMTEYTIRSLPNDPEVAKSVYQRWLANLLLENNVRSPSVDPMRSTPVGDLYAYHSYSVEGGSDLAGVVDLLHGFYAKDYLHRIRDLSILPDRTGALKLKMTVDAAALAGAGAERPAPSGKSYRLTSTRAEYRESILNRNFFRPPNQRPRFIGPSEVQAIVGKKSLRRVNFEDPEGGDLRFEWVSGPHETIELDEATGELQIDSDRKGEIEVKIRAVDDGFPTQSIEQTLIVKVDDPPPPPTPPMPTPAFDDATQTVLTALVLGGSNEWTAWLNIRTRGKTLKLRKGDSFEIGSVDAEVIEVTDDRMTVQVDDRQMDVRLNEKVADVVQRSLSD